MYAKKQSVWTILFLFLILIAGGCASDDADSGPTGPSQDTPRFRIVNNSGEGVSCNVLLRCLDTGIYSNGIDEGSSYWYQHTDLTLHFQSWGSAPVQRDYGYFDPEPGDTITLQ